MTIHYATSCSCKASEPLVGGVTPEYFQTPLEAAQRFLEHEARYMNTPDTHRYWAVHAAGRHVIAVV